MDRSLNQLLITIRGSRWTVTSEGQSAVYEMANAPKSVQHAIRLITDKWGTTLDGTGRVPKPVMHKARLLAEKHGQPYAGFTG